MKLDTGNSFAKLGSIARGQIKSIVESSATNEEKVEMLANVCFMASVIYRIAKLYGEEEK